MRCKGKKNGCINLRPTSTAARPNLYNVRERERIKDGEGKGERERKVEATINSNTPRFELRDRR